MLALQRTAGNRAVARALLQRQPPKAPAKAAKDDPQSRALWEWDPAEWAEKVSPVFRRIGYRGVIVTLASNTAYAFDADGGSLREIPVRLADNVRGSSTWKLDVAHAFWRDPLEVIMGDEGTPPLSEAGVRTLCEAMGHAYGGSDKFWVMLHVDPHMAFAPPKPGKAASGDTPAMRRNAKKVVKDLTSTWRDRPKHERSALVGTPVFRERYSERTGWHVRITLDQEVTEVPLRPGDSDKDVRDRVDAAVKKMQVKYDGTQGQRQKLTGAKSDPKGPAPPPWYVPFEGHAAVQSGKPLANAPPLPAVVLFKPDESSTHPTLIAGAIYDFRMQVQWQFAGDLEGLSAAGNAGYYWELLAASPADWYRLSGETPPEGMPGVSPAPTAAGAATGAAALPTESSTPRTEDQAVGSGTRVTRKDDATSAGEAEGRHVGEDMANDIEEGDYTGFAGEAVAGGFRIVKTHVVTAISDVLDRRDPSSRRVTLPEPGYYLVRCISASTTADEDSDWVRSPSVAVIPVKAQLNWGVAKASAKADLAKAGGHGTFARYVSELGSARSTLEAARRLQARLAADPGLGGRLSTDPVAAASELTVLELGVLTLADQNQTSIEQLVKDLAAQMKDAEAESQEKTVTSWHEELKNAPDGASDYAVGASFVVEDTGQQIPLRLMVGQAKDSTDAAPHWLVFDITTAKTRDRYDGRGMAGGLPLSADAGGHGAALREALRKFAGENPYGYGEIGLAWPASFGQVALKGSDLPRHLRSAPDAKKRKKNRRSAYVDIATLVIPVAKAAKLRGLVKGAETFVALAGAKNAIDALRDRARTRHLDEPGTLLELVQVIGGVTALGEGGKFVLQANDLVRAARRVGSSLELLTKLEAGIQIISIPLVVREQLNAIDTMTGASTEHKAATLAFVLGRAIKNGVVSVRAIHPTEQTQFYDDSTDPNKTGGTTDPRRTGGGGSGGGDGGGGGGATPPIPPNVHRDLQQFADVYRVVANVRREPPNPKTLDHAQHPQGRLRVELQWAGTATAGPRAMNAIEREAFNKMLTSMNVGVVPSDDMSGTPGAPAPIVRIEPTPRTGLPRPSERGTGQDARIDDVPSRVGQPGYEPRPPPARDVPGRAGLNDLEQRALDRYMARMRRTRRMTPQLEAQLRAATAEDLRRRLGQAIVEQTRVDQERARGRHVQQTNVPDPRQARFDHERDEGGGVSSRWNGADNQRPSEREIAEAKEVADATGEPVVFYGNSFAGVDGTIGNPPRLFQLKTAEDGPTLIRVITEAKQNAQRHGDRGLEVHVLAREVSLAQATEELRRTPVPFGSWIGRVTVHVRGGHFEVPSSGHS
jgi:hypothetical protein